MCFRWFGSRKKNDEEERETERDRQTEIEREDYKTVREIKIGEGGP